MRMETLTNKRTNSITSELSEIRKDFPILQQLSHGKPLAFLDNAASSQKPIQVIEALSQYYSTSHANIHRGVYELSQKATDAYENARETVRKFLNATDQKEIIFTRGATESINLVASTFGRKNIQEGDEILISHMEHHSNIVPWQMLCEEKGATLKVIPINDDGEIMMDKFHQMVNERTKMIALVHISNSLGTVNPVREVIAEAKNRQIPVLLDGAQAIPHQSIDVRALDCDFYVFSGHKVFGPTGIGVLYARHEILVDMPPYQGGGDMIKSVRFDRTTYNDLPHKFEAGTPNIAGAVGLAAALDYVDEIGYSMIEAWENELLKAATEVLSQIEGLRIIGTAQDKASVISFDIEGIHPHDIGQFLDFEGVAVRTGHHCTQPIMDRFDIPATTRASFAFYNTMEEVERLAAGIVKTIKLFRGNA